MKIAIRSWASFCTLFGLSLMFSVAFAQGVFQKTDALLAQADAAQADLLAPNNYADAMKAYERAKKDSSNGREDKAAKALEDANSSLNKAIEASTLGAVTFADTLEARERAVNSNTEKFEPDMWADAEKEFNNAAKKLEGGSVKPAQKMGTAATGLYDAAELAAIKTSVVGNVRQLIASAEKAKVDKSAPKTFQNARDLVAQAESNLDTDRYSTNGSRMQAAEAEYQTKHATYIAGQSEAVKSKDLTVEDLILSWERPLRDVAGALGASNDMSEGYATPGSEALIAAQRMKQVNSEMAARIIELDMALGNTEVLVEETERLQRQLKDVEKLFGADQAIVLRESNDLLLRLIGLSFPVGQAVIETQYFSLLTQVQSAISIYPGSEIVIEGHTDSSGGDKPNMKLSQERAEAVREYLIANQGLPADRVTAVGYGKTRPIETNETSEGRARNRRIDVVIKDARARQQ